MQNQEKPEAKEKSRIPKWPEELSLNPETLPPINQHEWDFQGYVVIINTEFQIKCNSFMVVPHAQFNKLMTELGAPEDDINNWFLANAWSEDETKNLERRDDDDKLYLSVLAEKIWTALGSRYVARLYHVTGFINATVIFSGSFLGFSGIH